MCLSRECAEGPLYMLAMYGTCAAHVWDMYGTMCLSRKCAEGPLYMCCGPSVHVSVICICCGPSVHVSVMRMRRGALCACVNHVHMLKALL